MAIAVDLHNGFKPPLVARILQHRSFAQLNSSLSFFESLDSTFLAHSLKQAVVAASNIHRSFSTPCLSERIEENNTVAANTGQGIELVAGRGSPAIRSLVIETSIAMASGVDPVPVLSGLGGAYYLCNKTGDKIAVAKPFDPKGSQLGFRNSVRDDETGFREVAAYLLDHNAFAGVPPTALVRISHVAFNGLKTLKTPKIASVQRFVDHDFDGGDLGPSGFSVSSVHRIGILDVRLLNLDRHAGNILVKKNRKEEYSNYSSESNYVVGSADLVPIDHGLCLPELLDDPYFEWLHWPQASLPFPESEVEYISQLDPFKDAEILRSELPLLRESSIRVLVICTIFLKFAACVARLCLADIGGMMTREYIGTKQEPSVLETLCIMAKANVKKIRCKSPQRMATLSGKPPKIPLIDFSSAHFAGGFPQNLLSSVREKYNNKYYNMEQEQEENDNEDHEGVSFKGMSEEEFRLFLENFEKLLPKAFEERKNMGLKKRLGT